MKERDELREELDFIHRNKFRFSMFNLWLTLIFLFYLICSVISITDYVSADDSSPADVLPDDIIEFFMEHEGRPIEWSDVGGSQGDWARFQDVIKNSTGMDLPDYEDIEDFQSNIVAGFAGQIANMDSTALGSLVSTAIDINDIFDYIFFDLDSLEWFVDSDGEEFIKSGIESELYTTPSISGPVVGNWYSVPGAFVGGGYTWNITDSSSNTAPVYYCFVDSGWNFGIYIASFVQFQSVTITGTSTNTLTTSNRYAGSVSVGFYSSSLGMAGAYRPSGISMYNNINTALADLFGQEWTEPSPDPVLNGSGTYIGDGSQSIKPIGLTSSIYYSYPTYITNNYNVGEQYPDIVRTYYPMVRQQGIPNWLVQPQYEIPEEPDYLGLVEVELPDIESDSGFITDVYNILPSGIVTMITVALALGIVMKVIS